MKQILFVFTLIILIIVLILVFGILGENKKNETNWGISDEHGNLVNGTWGVELKVEYKDGSEEYLTDKLPSILSEVSFKDKKVDNFQYILYMKGLNDKYDSVEIDLSDFVIIVNVKDELTDIGEEIIFKGIANINLDDSWYKIYNKKVEASSLVNLEINYKYNLSLTPSGIISCRTSSAGTWFNLPLPEYFYITFHVNGDQDDDGLPDDEDPDYDPEENNTEEGGGNRWIEVKLGGNIP